MALNDEVIHERCECGSLEFHICYDVRIMGKHAECAKCGIVFLGLRSS